MDTDEHYMRKKARNEGSLQNAATENKDEQELLTRIAACWQHLHVLKLLLFPEFGTAI